tara:strand:+ start:723 stop:956 length:234 start_codon:yes stop_codon:yes gene_type:complete
VLIRYFLTLYFFNTYAEPTWNLYKNKNGVSVYYQSHSDNIFEVKAQMNEIPTSFASWINPYLAKQQSLPKKYLQHLY